MPKKKTAKRTAKKATKSRQSSQASAGRDKKASGSSGSKKKKKAVKTKKRRPRSRGKRRNKATQADHAVNSVEAKAQGKAPPNDPAVEVPETFTPGPSVELLDGTNSVQRDREVINKMLDHPEWKVPPIAFEAIPQRLTRIALNLGDEKDKAGNVIRQNVPDAGTWTTNQQLTAIKQLTQLNAENLKKLRSLRPAEVRIANEKPTVVSTDDQRAAVLAAIAAEIQRRERGGSVSN